MAPVKFDDLSKLAKGILTDDYSKSYGNEFKAKQKVGSIGAIFTTTVAIDAKFEGKVSTPATASLKFPKPFGLAGITIDKLEYNKSGDWKLETSFDKALLTVDNLSVDVKSDLAKLDSLSTGATFTGIADTQLKFEVKPLTQAFSFEATRKQGPATLGLKLNEKNLQAPDVGLCVSQSGVFASLLVTDKFKTFEAHAHYKLTNNVEVAATAKQGSKGLDAGAGFSFQFDDKTTIKAKVNQKTDVESVIKYSPAGGLSFLLAGKYAGGKCVYGLGVNIE